MTPRTTPSARSRRQSPAQPPAPTRPRPTARQWSVDFRRALRRHRRKLAVVATIAAVLSGLAALAPPRPETVSVVGAAHLLPAGSTIAADDLELIALPRDAVPSGAATDSASLVGQQVAGPVPRRQVLTTSALLSHRSGSGLVVAPLPLADDRVSGLLESGDVVDVLAADSQTGKTRVVASAVRVVAGPIPPSDDGGSLGTAGGGAAGEVSGDRSGLVLVEVSSATATALATAAATSVLGIVWR